MIGKRFQLQTSEPQYASKDFLHAVGVSCVIPQASGSLFGCLTGQSRKSDPRPIARSAIQGLTASRSQRHQCRSSLRHVGTSLLRLAVHRYTLDVLLSWLVGACPNANICRAGVRCHCCLAWVLVKALRPARCVLCAESLLLRLLLLELRAGCLAAAVALLVTVVWWHVVGLRSL